MSQEGRYDKEKKREEQYQAILAKVNEDKTLRDLYNKENYDKNLRMRKDFLRRLHWERREAGMDGVVLKAKEVAILHQNLMEQEERLAAEMDIIHRQEIKEEKMRQYIRENSHELKELECQLKAAYVNKTLIAQVAEKEAQRIEKKMQHQRAWETLAAACGTEEERQIECEKEEKKRKSELKIMLQDQIIEKDRLRQEEFKEYMEERKQMDDIVRKIREEEIKQQEQKQISQKKMKEEMEKFLEAREVWKAKERFIIEEENRKLREYTQKNCSIGNAKELEKQARDAAAEKLRLELTEKAICEKRKKEEREEMITALILNQEEENDNLKARKELMDEMALKHESRETFRKVLAEKEKQKQDEKDVDKMFVERMIERLDEESRKEKEKEDKKRQERINDRRYNEETMRRNAEKRAEELKLVQLINKMQEDDDKKRMEMIEQERLRMLREHAPKLLGYFPKGCLREKDLENLGLTGNSPLPASVACIPKSPEGKL